MAWQYTPYTFPLIFAGMVSGTLAAYIWRSRRSTGAGSIALLMAALTVWSLAYAIQLSCTTLSAQVFWGKVQYFGIVLTPVMWFAFAAQYTGRGRWLRRPVPALLAVEPLVTLALVWTNDRHGLIWNHYRLEDIHLFSWASSGLEVVRTFGVKVSAHGIGFWFHTTYSYALLAVGTVLILDALVRARRVYRGQAIALLIFALTPWIGNAVYLSDLNPYPHLDPTPLAFILTGPVLAFGLFRFRLGDLAPIAHATIIEGMNDGVIMLDAQNRIVDLNPAAQRLTGLAVPEAVGRPVEQVLSEWPDHLAFFSHDTLVEREITLGKGDMRRTFDVRVSPLCDQRGRLLSKVFTLRDITERKRAEEALRISEAKYRELVQSANSVIAQIDTDGNITFWNRFAEQFFGYSAEEILGRNAVGTVVPAVDSSGHDLAAMIKDLTQDPDRYSKNENENMRRNGERVWVAWTNKPLFDEKGNVQELLCIGNDITDRKRMEEALQKHKEHLEATVLDRTAQLTAANIRLLQEIADRKQIEERLRLSEERYRRVLDTSNDRFVVVDGGANLLFANRAWQENTGYIPGEINGLDLIHPDDREMIATWFQRVMTGESARNVAYRGLGKGGRMGWVEANADLIDWPGSEKAVLLVTRDISERMRMEEELRRSEERYHLILETSPDRIFVMDPDGKFLFANKTWHDTISYSFKEINALDILDTIYPDDREIIGSLFQKVLGGEPIRNIEYRGLTKHGEIKWMEANADLIDWPGAGRAILTVVREITDRKEMEDKLRLSEMRHSRILDATHDMVCVYDENGGILYANRAWKENSVFSLEETLKIGIFKTVHPDDVGKLKNLFERARGGERFLNVEYRVVGPNGEIKWRQANGGHIDWPGAPNAVLNATRDITERKAMEEVLRLSEERYSRIMDSSHDMVLVADANAHLLFANRAHYEQSGYTVEEANKVGIMNLVHPHDRARMQEYFQRVMSGEPIRNIEYRRINKNGEIRWVESNADPIRWSGTDKAAMNILRDITERKRAEETLRVSNRFLEIGNRNTDMGSLLRESVEEVKSLTGCEAIGIRILDEKGNIPYQSYIGFSDSFYRSESPLSTKVDQCMCINVIAGATNPSLSYYTPAGSFWANNTTFLLATVPEAEKGRTRNVCNQCGYESVALVPIRAGNRIIGLIHVADKSENMVPLETVALLETAAMELGTAILRVQMEQALMKSEERYRNIFEEAPDIFYMLDLETWKITEANKYALKALDYGPERIGDIRVSEIIHPDDYEKAAGRLVEMVTKRDRMPNFPLRILTRTGEIRHIEQSGVIFWDDTGRAKSFLGLAHDVTYRKKQEEMIEKRNEKLAALYEIADAANESLDLKTVIDLIIELVPRITNSDGVCIYSFDESTQRLYYRAHRGFSESFVRGTDGMELGEGMHGSVAQSRKGVIINDVLASPKRARRGHTTEFDHIIIVPLMVRGKLLGTLTVARKPGNPYDAEDLDLMTAFANQISVAMDNAALYTQLLQRERYFDSILETSRDGIVVTSEEQRVVYRNSSLSKMFGHDEIDDLSGINTDAFFAPESYPVLQWVREKLDKREEIDRIVEWKARRRDGSMFDAEMRIGYFSEGGKRYDVGVVRDVTERKRMEAQLQQASKLAAIGELAAGVAHEINNPVATIHLQAGLMKDLVEDDREKLGDPLSRRLGKSVRIIEDQVRRCQRVTNNLLSFGRTPEAKSEIFNVNELLRKAMEFVVHLTDKRPQVTMILDEKIPFFRGDPNRLEQVFVNLLNNAVKAIPSRGAITIFSGLDPQGSIRIEFRDSGPGIPDEIKDHIFDPFFTTRPAGEGTGLGLSISHFIIKEMSGKLEAESRPGQGAVFTVTLPSSSDSKENITHV